jgi:hypothetical protein
MARASRRSESNSPFWRLLLSLVGLSLVLLGIGHFLLFFVGSTAVADIETRRFGGSTDQYPASARYEWAVDYRFVAADGRTYEGHTRRRGHDLGVTVERKVYYLPQAPVFNALEREVWPNLGQLVLVGLGLFLIVVINTPGKRPPPRQRAIRRADGSPDGPGLQDYDDSVEEVFHRDE